MTNKANGLRADWAADYEVWRPQFDSVFRELESTPLKILSWGPGPHQKRWYSKRQTICSHLADNPYNSVFTPEELEQRDDRFKKMLDPYKAQELQAEAADIIICLQVDDPSVTGPPGEVLKWGEDPLFQAKIRLLAHKRTLSSPKGFLHHATQSFPSHLTFPYSTAQFEACVDIRAKCDEWVSAARKDKWFRARRPAV